VRVGRLFVVNVRAATGVDNSKKQPGSSYQIQKKGINKMGLRKKLWVFGHLPARLIAFTETASRPQALRVPAVALTPSLSHCLIDMRVDGGVMADITSGKGVYH
jgi:hypothetical protein